MKKMLCFLALVLIAGMMTAEAKGPENPGVVPPQADFRGNTYGEWHVLWWQWADALSNAESPVWQRDGVVDTSNQSGNVWFLAGYFGDWFSGSGGPVTLTRQITIPSGTALFFPILNGELTPVEWQWGWILENYPLWLENWQLENPEGTAPDAIADLKEDLNVAVPEPTIEELWALLDSWFSDPEALAESMSASIDGRPVNNLGAYVARAPEAFTTSFPAENHVEFYYPEGAEDVMVVVDGWALLLEPLSVGEHTVKFKALLNPEFGMDITYQITVVPAGKFKK